jgi:hypothetical protein
MKRLTLCLALLLSTGVMAKLPPQSEEAKAKAAETKAKTAHGDKVAAWKLCQSQNQVAERYRKQSGKPAEPGSLGKCEDPGPFVVQPVPQSIMPGGAAVGTKPPEAGDKAPQPAKK